MLTKKIPEASGWAVAVALLVAGCSPSGPDLLLRGDRQLQDGKPAEAVRILEQATELMPDSARAWNHLGLAYHAAGNPVEARKSYSRALQLDPNFADPHFNLGMMEYELNRFAEAEGPLRTFLAWQPKRADAWARLGQAQFQLKQLEAAERSLVAALQLDRSDPDVWNTLGMIQVQRKRWRDAAQQFGEAVRLSPKNPSSRLNLAVTLHQYLGDRRASLPHYREFLALQPEAAEAESVRTVVRQLEVQLGLIQRPAVVSNAVVSAAQAVPALSPGPAGTVATSPPPAATFRTTITNPLSVRPLVVNTNAVSQSGAAVTTPPPRVVLAPPAPTPTPTSLSPSPSPSTSAPTSTPPVGSLISTNRPVRGAVLSNAVALPTIALRTNLGLSTTTPTSSPIVSIVKPTNATPVGLSPAKTNLEAVAPVPPPRQPTIVRVEEPPQFLPARNTAPKPPPPESPTATPAIVPIPTSQSTLPPTSPVVTPPVVSTPAPATRPVDAPVIGNTPVIPAAPGDSGIETGTGDTSTAVGVAEEGSGLSGSPKRGVLQRINPVAWFRRDEPGKREEAKPKRETGGSKLNPVNWFRGSDKEAPAAVPGVKSAASVAGIPSPATVTNPVPVPTLTASPAPVAPSTVSFIREVDSRPTASSAAAVNKPAAPRYTPQVTSVPVAGNRSEAQSYFNAGLAAHERKDLTVAAGEYQRAARVDPSYFEAHYNLSGAALNLGDLPLALTAGEHALALRPDSDTARWNFALALQRSKFPVEAAEELERLLERQPNQVRAHMMLAAICATDLADTARAREHYERALQLEPQHPQASSIRDWLTAHPKR
jgi:tetratricopeptide (TPR) repeat protein